MSSMMASVGVPTDNLDVCRSVTLLVVSSSLDLRRNLVSRLQSEDWVLQEAASGAEALEKIDAEEVAVVVLDPGLPDLKVDDFRTIIQSQYPEVIVIPINPHTGQPIMNTASPNSISFQVARKMERGTPFRFGQPTSGGNPDDEDSP